MNREISRQENASLQEAIKVESRSKLGWRAALRSAVDPKSLDEGLWVSSSRPDVVAVIVSTSGSMDDRPELLQEIIREVRGLAEDFSQQIRIVVIPADTAVRGKILELDPMEMEDLQDLLTCGWGITNFTAAINHVVEYYDKWTMCGGKLRHIFYVTDLDDYPPAREELMLVMPRITFITTPEQMNKDFAEAVSGWADVVMIEDAKEIELAYREQISESHESRPAMGLG